MVAASVVSPPNRKEPLMRMRSMVGIAAVAVLAGAALSAAPVSAAVTSFVNPLATAPTDNFDIVSSDVDFTAATLTVTSHTQNLVAGETTYFVYVLPAGKSLAENNGAFGFGGTSENGASVTNTQHAEPSGAITGETANSQVTLTVDVASQTLRASIPTSLIPTSAPLDFFAVTYGDSGSAYIAKTFSSSPVSVTGLGPLPIPLTATTTKLALSFGSQAYGGTPVAALVSVSPANASGSVQILSDGVPVANVPVSNGTAFANLPQTLASGPHSISATFTPTDAQAFSASSSTAAPFTVTSVAKATKTTVTLSKKSQKFKKSPAKVKVVVTEKAVGTVTIFDGKKKLKTVTLKGGKATYTLSKTLKKGKHTIKAVFTPTNVESFKTSTSKSVKLTVKK